MHTRATTEDEARRLQDLWAWQPPGGVHLLPRTGTLGDAVPATEVTRWGAALPDQPLALRRPARYSWSPGQLRVRDLPLDPVAALPSTATLADVVARLLRDESGWVAVADDRGFDGVVTTRAVLEAVQRGQLNATAGSLVERDPPSCAPESSVADAVHLMLARHLRTLPVLAGRRCLGALPLAGAAACEDPEVRGILEAAITAVSLFARPWW